MPKSDKSSLSTINNNQVSEATALLWQSQPAQYQAEIIAAVANGAVLLVPREKQEYIDAQFDLLKANLVDTRQQLADVQYRNDLLIESLWLMIQAVEQSVLLLPEGADLLKRSKIFSGGELNWSQVIKVATNFMLDRGIARESKPYFAKLLDSFDSNKFSQIQFPLLLGIMQERGIDFSTFGSVIETLKNRNQQLNG
jgi:hypothetical protein